jgi:YbaB/EbfC DNA-binding family protein
VSIDPGSTSVGPQSPVDALDRMLTETRRVLAAVRSGGGAPAVADPAGDPPLRGEGSGADGLVRAVVTQGGRLESVAIDPRLLRQGVEALGEQLVAAVNAALDDLAAQAPPADPSADLAGLSSRLESLQDQSVRQMAMFSQAMNDVVAHLRSAGRG